MMEMKRIAYSALLLPALVVLGSGCQAPRQPPSQEPPAQPVAQQPEQASATLEPSEDLPAGAFKASGNKKAPVRLMIYVPGRLGGSAIAFPYDLTMQMLAQLQQEYPGKIRVEVYPIDTPEGRDLMKQAHLVNPSVVLLTQPAGQPKTQRKQVFDMTPGEKIYQPRAVADAIRQAMPTKSS